MAYKIWRQISSLCDPMAIFGRSAVRGADLPQRNNTMKRKKLSHTQRMREFQARRILLQIAVAALLILVAIAALSRGHCSCGTVSDDTLARLQVADGGRALPNRAVAYSIGASEREDGYHVYRSFTRGGAPDVYAVKFGFAFAVSVDIGCADYFRYPLPGITDRDEFTLYIRMRAFDLGEHDQRTKPEETRVGPWSAESAIRCQRVRFLSWVSWAGQPWLNWSGTA